MPSRVSIIVSTLCSVLLAVAVAGCSKSVANSAGNAPSKSELVNSDTSAAKHQPSAAPAGAILGYVEFQDHKVTIRESAQGPRYTLADKMGNAVGETLTRDQFAAQFPTLFQAFEQAQARTLDASAREALDTPRERR